MRRFLLCFLFLTFIFNSNALSQVNGQAKTEEEMKALLCNKWKIVETESGGKKMIVPPQMTTYILLKSDGTVIETDEGIDYQSSWTYDHKAKTFITKGKDGVQKHIIIRITKTDLVYKDTVDGMTITWTLKKVV